MPNDPMAHAPAVAPEQGAPASLDVGRRRPAAFGPGLFWAWNIVFLAFAVFGMAPMALPELFDALGRGMAAPAMLVSGAILVAIPVVAVLLGATVLRNRPDALLGAFYGLEAPLLLVFAVRFFAIGQLNPATGLLFWAAIVGLAAYGWSLVRPPRAGDRTPILASRLALLTMLLAACVYVASWLGIYAVGLAGALGELVASAWGELARNVRQLSATGMSQQLGLILWGTLVFTITGTLFVLAPIVVPFLHGQAWLAAFRALAERTTRRRAGQMAGAVATLSIIAFAAANVQPQARAFAHLAEPPASAAEARALQAGASGLRAGLVNAFLWPRRYLGARGEVTHVRDLYLDAWGSTQLANAALGAWEVLARPLLYEAVSGGGSRGGARSDAVRAAQLYESVFDAPLVESERSSIVEAVVNDWQVERMASTLLDVDDREVFLERQEVAVAEHGDWAEVEVHEVYANQTFAQQEVLYHFSLPETAAITGLWLGTSDERAARHAFRVAPRGAAQAVYRAETVRRVDPALVEQLGPRQYRLRAFPVPPRERRWDDAGAVAPRTMAGEPMHLWLTYRVLAATDAASSGAVWPLPRLAEKRNVYWDARSVRTVGGAPFDGSTAWLPDALPASAAPPRQAHRIALSGGRSVAIVPASAVAADPDSPPLRLAVVLDRSLSMAEHQATVDAAMASVEAAADGPVDAYLTASPFRFDAPVLTTTGALSLDERLPFGGMAPAVLLGQFASLRQGRTYDAVLVLTDQGGFTASSGAAPVADLGSPTWLVHLDGAFPPGYDDATQDALIASGGGIAGSVPEALARLMASREQSEDGAPSGLVLDDSWHVVASSIGHDDPARSDAPTEADGDGLGPIAARAAVALAARELETATTEARRTAIMDGLHAMAIEQAVVTPFSSLIVLVNERQERDLDAAEQAADRFAREAETGTDELSPALAMTVVPEPHEYALLALAALALAWRYGPRRWRPSRP